MAKTQSIPPIPPLLVTKAHKIDSIEGKLARALEHCMDPYGRIANELKVKTYLSSYVVAIFTEYLEAYIASPNLKLWMPELKSNSAKWVLNCLADYRGVTEEDVERYGELLLATLDEYIKFNLGNSPNPLLAALAETQFDAKQASAHARAGIDLASASPLLAMIAAQESTRGLVKAPAPAVSKRRFPSQVKSESAARKVEAYMNGRALNQTQFATKAGMTDRTLRNFLKTGVARRSTLDGIASAMGITKENLLS